MGTKERKKVAGAGGGERKERKGRREEKKKINDTGVLDGDKGCSEKSSREERTRVHGVGTTERQDRLAEKGLRKGINFLREKREWASRLSEKSAPGRGTGAAGLSFWRSSEEASWAGAECRVKREQVMRTER